MKDRPVRHWHGICSRLTRGNKLEKKMLIYMDDYRKAKTAQAEESRYDEELLCVNWNPAVRLVALTCYQKPEELSPQLPEDFSNVDVTAFMGRVYALASQI
jgi:hypothetical protein